jgi:YD repeat-containing protein
MSRQQRVATVTGYDGTSMSRSYTYDSLGRKQTETIARRISPTNPALANLTTTYQYDALDRVTRVTDPLGNIAETVYDANSKVKQINAYYKKADATFVTRTLVTRSVTNTAIISADELYDPSTGIWTASGSLLHARYSHTATLLPSGLVLVSGGWGPGITVPIASAELYDPATGKWAATGSMVTTGNNHAATLLPSGRVLVSGGGAAYAAIAEEYF